MKKLFLVAFVLQLAVFTTPVQTFAGSIEDKSMTTAEKSAADIAQIKILTARLEEIKAMDKSNLGSSEKREMRKEVRSIKKQLSDIGGGVYISVGALIIIILLLIILL